MEMLIIYIIQVILFVFVCITFKYQNNIWYVLNFICICFPVIGIVYSVIALSVSYTVAFNSYEWERKKILRDTKLNRWLYNSYFKN